MVPLFGHTMGHCGVAIQSTRGWMLHAGDAYFDADEVKLPQRRCALQVGLFQMINQTHRGLRLHNQARLRAFTAEHPEVQVFCAHNPWELEDAQRQSKAVPPPADIRLAAA
jgi:glyoxylase-like metal-dependent hydrolase (beta-lactamase superfamily II)